MSFVRLPSGERVIVRDFAVCGRRAPLRWRSFPLLTRQKLQNRPLMRKKSPQAPMIFREPRRLGETAVLLSARNCIFPPIDCSDDFGFLQTWILLPYRINNGYGIKHSVLIRSIRELTLQMNRKQQVFYSNSFQFRWLTRFPSRRANIEALRRRALEIIC